MSWDDDLPADVSFELLVYDDGNPPHVLTYTALGHKWGDPPDEISPTETLGLSSFLHIINLYLQLGHGRQSPTLASERARWGIGVAYAEKAGIRFEFSLAPYTECDPEHTRVWARLGSRYRRELFTDEHRRIVKAYEADRDARLRRQSLED